MQVSNSLQTIVNALRFTIRPIRFALPSQLLTFDGLQSRLLHIASSFFLISTLLFAQVAVNFFHRNHDVHQNKSVTAPLKNGTAGVQKHDEHCKVCSVDFFNHVFVGNDFILTNHSFTSDYKKQVNDFTSHAFVSFSQGRAPPLS